MPRLLPEPDMDKYEYATVRRIGTTGPGHDKFQRVLRLKPEPVPDPEP